MKAIFFDRDGTLIEHVGKGEYTVSPAQIKMKSDIAVLKELQEDFLFFVVTNAGAVGRGVCTEEDFWEGEIFFEAKLLEKGIKIEACVPAFWNPRNPENFKEY